MKGMTFVEVLVSLSVFVLIVVSFFLSLQYTYKVQNYSLFTTLKNTSDYSSLIKMSELILSAEYSDVGDYVISDFGPNFFEFFSNADSDDDIEKIKFFVEDGKLKQAITNKTGNPPQYLDTPDEIRILIYDVVNSDYEPVFSYYDKNGNQIQNLSDLLKISFVKINVKTKSQNGETEYYLKSSAAIRNAK